MNCTPAYVTVLTANADRIFSVSQANLTTPQGEYRQIMVTSTLHHLVANPRLYVEASNTDGLTQDGFRTLAQVNEFIENHGGPRFERGSVAVHGVCTDVGAGNMHIKGLNAAMIIQSRLAGKIYQGRVFENGLGEWLPDTGNDYDVVRSPGDVPIHTELTNAATDLPFTRGDFKDIWLHALADFGV